MFMQVNTVHLIRRFCPLLSVTFNRRFPEAVCTWPQTMIVAQLCVVFTFRLCKFMFEHVPWLHKRQQLSTSQTPGDSEQTPNEGQKQLNLEYKGSRYNLANIVIYTSL